MWEIIKEDFESPKPINEGWKENVLATAISVASLFGNVKGQAPQVNTNGVGISQQAKNDSLRLDINKVFTSGKYLIDAKDDATIKTELQKFGKAIIKNQNSDFIIQVVSSESRVPNYDAEKQSPTFGQKLDTGVLAQKRAQTVDFILKAFTNQLKKEGTLKGDAKIVAPKILIGNEAWGSKDPNTGAQRTKDDPAFTKDQYVYVNIKIVNNRTVDPFSAFADMGEAIYFNNRLAGMAFFPTRRTGDMSKAGNKETPYENVLFKTVKPNTQVNGNKNEDVYLKSYIIPWQWWNANITSHTLTPENINYILSHFETK